MGVTLPTPATPGARAEGRRRPTLAGTVSDATSDQTGTVTDRDALTTAGDATIAYTQTLLGPSAPSPTRPPPPADPFPTSLLPSRNIAAWLQDRPIWCWLVAILGLAAIAALAWPR